MNIAFRSNRPFLVRPVRLLSRWPGITATSRALGQWVAQRAIGAGYFHMVPILCRPAC